MGLYKMPISQLLSGQPFQWTALGQVNTDQTGFYLNHSPGFQRDPSGNITPFFPNVVVYHSAGDPSPTTWDLTFSILNKDNPFAPLNRYYGNGTHWVTSGYVTPGYNLEMTLGQMVVAPQPGATHKLYSCQSGADHYLSGDVNCEGGLRLGVTGEVFNDYHDGMHMVFPVREHGAGGEVEALVEPASASPRWSSIMRRTSVRLCAADFGVMALSSCVSVVTDKCVIARRLAGVPGTSRRLCGAACSCRRGRPSGG
jgi:hypothetical protein